MNSMLMESEWEMVNKVQQSQVTMDKKKKLVLCHRMEEEEGLWCFLAVVP